MPKNLVNYSSGFGRVPVRKLLNVNVSARNQISFRPVYRIEDRSVEMTFRYECDETQWNALELVRLSKPKRDWRYYPPMIDGRPEGASGFHCLVSGGRIISHLKGDDGVASVVIEATDLTWIHPRRRR
jgi:hypothetical protein